MIYIIQHEHGPVKIGHSKDPESRCKSLQTSTPYKLKLMNTFPGNMQDETHIHRYFAKNKIRGEWFNLTDEIANLMGADCLPDHLKARKIEVLPKRTAESYKELVVCTKKGKEFTVLVNKFSPSRAGSSRRG